MKFKILFFCLLFSLVFVLPAQAQPDVPLFQDIEGSFAKEAILELAGRGIISGIDTAEFGPEQNIKRRDFAVLLSKVLGIQPVVPLKPAFSDVPLYSSQAGYVEALAKLGILGGEGAGRLGAEGPVLRQDAALMLFRALADESDLASLDGWYLDEDKISQYARSGVGYVTHKGLMIGSEGCFSPVQALTRAEAAVLASQLLKMKKAQVITPPKHVSSGKMELEVGETSNIGPENVSIPLAYTTVYGVDNPSIGTISAGGTFTAGKQTESATITVNSGLASYSVKMSVCTAPEDDQNGSVSSFNNITNKELAYGAVCRVEQFAPDPGFQETEYKQYSGPVDGLTSQSSAWTGFLHQQGREVTADLTKAQTVTGVSLEFLQDAESGINLPGYLSAEVSMDGKAWYRLGRVEHSNEYTGTVVKSYNFTFSFQPVVTRYIKLSFPVDVWVFARHLSVKGGGYATTPAVLAPATYTDSATDSYLNIEDINNILLVYTGSHGADGTWKDEDFMPMVAYQDPVGGVGGSMFDTMLFLPYPDLPCTRTGWNAYLSDLFARGAQLSALDEAVGHLNEISNLKIKEKVILTIPYPEPTQQDFGKLMQGGASINFSGSATKVAQSVKNRFAAVQWFYNNMMDRWKKAGLNNLELAGVYWYHESMEQNVAGETELVQDAARLVRNGGHDFFWIPYYGSYGYEDWRMYGFTHTLLQPNYYAPDSPPEERMDCAADLAGRYHLGLELECDENILYSRYYFNLFYQQLNRAQQLGLDRDITLAWYTGSKTLVKAGKSSIPQVRAIYDDIYRWISGNYVAPARKVATQ